MSWSGFLRRIFLFILNFFIHFIRCPSKREFFLQEFYQISSASDLEAATILGSGFFFPVQLFSLHFLVFRFRGFFHLPQDSNHFPQVTIVRKITPDVHKMGEIQLIYKASKNQCEFPQKTLKLIFRFSSIGILATEVICPTFPGLRDR